MHGLRQANDHTESEHNEQAGIKIESSKSLEEMSSWSQTMFQTAERLLAKWIDNNLHVEHYMGTVLEPRFKQLQLICNDIEKCVLIILFCLCLKSLELKCIVNFAKLQDSTKCEKQSSQNKVDRLC